MVRDDMTEKFFGVLLFLIKKNPYFRTSERVLTQFWFELSEKRDESFGELTSARIFKFKIRDFLSSQPASH